MKNTMQPVSMPAAGTEGQVVLLIAGINSRSTRLRALFIASAVAFALAVIPAGSAQATEPSGCYSSVVRTGTLCVTYGYLKIIKVADPDDSSAKFQFKLDSSATPIFTSYGSGYSDIYRVTTGNHSITEVLPSDWDLKSATCSNGTGSLSGTTLSSVKVNADVKTTCTFTNKQKPKPATLKVIKKVVNDNSGTLRPADFSLWVKSGDANVDGSPAPGSEDGKSYTLPAGDYVVGEDAQPGYTASIWGDCAANGSVTLAAGESRTCTITNNDVIHPSISIVKSANPTLIYRGEQTTYTIVVTNDGDDPLAEVVVEDDTCGPLEYQSGDEGKQGLMEVGESWTLTCTTSLDQNTLNTVTVTAKDTKGDTVSALAVAYVEVIDPPVTPPTSEPTVAPKAVAGVKLAKYNRCISRRFTIRPAISGGTPRVTVLKIDGKKRVTSRSTTPKFVVNTAKYKLGQRHRVEVTVTFTDGRKATARSSFTRCSASGAADPRFTG